MKPFVLSFFLLGLMSLAADELPVVKVEADLARNIGKRVILDGIYRNPGKGSRSIDCGFVSLDIEDYSFYRKSEAGTLVSDVSNGDRIRFEAELKFIEGNTFLVSKVPRDIQWAPPPIKVIKGKEYYVRPPSYSIRDAKLVIVLMPAKWVEQDAGK